MASNSIFYRQPHKPFDYSLRVSRKAKYAKLRIKPYGGIEVVIPVRFPKKAVPDLVNQHADWIQQQLKKQQERIPAPVLPDEIHLAINDFRTEIVYGANQQQGTKNPSQLFITNSGYQQSVKQLRKWIRQQAWALLPPMLESVSQETGLSYKKISIRSQKTRWGSCSSRGTISLNDQLLFVERDNAEYLMIHELCHTRHMNHSAKFWDLVEHHCADYRRHELALNRAKADIPGWILRDMYS
jgi:predicted metal-dependent hydrolase